MFGDAEIKYGDHYKFLGVKTTSDSRNTKKITSKINKGHVAIHQLHEIVWNNNIS